MIARGIPRLWGDEFVFPGGRSHRIRELSPQLLSKAWSLCVFKHRRASSINRSYYMMLIRQLAYEWRRRVGFTPQKGDVVRWRGLKWRVVQTHKFAVRLKPWSRSNSIGSAIVKCVVPLAHGGFYGATLVKAAA